MPAVAGAVKASATLLKLGGAEADAQDARLDIQWGGAGAAVRHAVAGLLGERMNEEAGLSLVEMIVTIFMIAITFTALLSGLVTSFRAIAGNEAQVVATALSNELLETMASSPWEELGLRFRGIDETDAPSATFEGEDVVLLGDDAEAQAAFETIERAGREFAVRRWITWAAEGDQEIKRITVILDWQVGTRDVSLRTESLRAPDPVEVIDLEVGFLRLESESTDENGVVTVGTEVELNEDSENTETIEATIEVSDPGASVVIRWTDRDGVNRSRTPTATSDPRIRELESIPVNVGRFPHGPLSFVVVATSDGVSASNTQTLTFFYPLGIRAITVTADGIPPTDGKDSTVDTYTVTESGESFVLPVFCTPTGQSVGPVRLGATVDGLVGADSVSGAVLLEWWIDDQAQLSQEMQFVDRTEFGADFETFLAGPFSIDSQVTFRVTADRDAQSEAFQGSVSETRAFGVRDAEGASC